MYSQDLCLGSLTSETVERMWQCIRLVFNMYIYAETLQKKIHIHLIPRRLVVRSTA